MSCAAWGLFSIAILVTATYALVVVRDLTMAAIFAGNMLACLAIVKLTLAPMPQWELSLEALSMKSIGHVLSSLGRQGRGLLRLAVAGC